MFLQQLHTMSLWYVQKTRRSIHSARQLSLLYLVITLLCCSFIPTFRLFADSLLVTEEIRYHLPEAGEVFLVWGVDGWAGIPEATRPPGTIVREAVMYTPMIREGDAFVVRLQVPPNTIVDYTFKITKTREGLTTEVWDTNDGRDYHTQVTQDDVIEVYTNLRLPQQQFPANTKTIRFLLFIGLGITLCASAIFAIRRDTSFFLWRILQARELSYLWDLLYELVARDMKLRYKRSLLGLTWSLLNPLAQLLVFTFIFGVVFSLDIPNYASFVFTGLLVWTWFQTSLFQATGAIVDNHDLVRRPGFPIAVLPVVTVTTHLIHFLLALPILLLFLALEDSSLTPVMMVLPALIILQYLFTLSLAYLVATWHVTFRDTQHLLGIALLLVFYLTPIFYDASFVPEKYRIYYNLNPMVHLVAAYRAILLHGELPAFQPLLVIGFVSVVLVFASYRFFIHTGYRFVEEL